MFLKTTVVVLIVLTVPGPRADSNGDQGRDAFWDYISQLTNDAKDGVDQIQGWEIGRRLNYRIKDNLQKLTPVPDDFRVIMTEFVEKLRQQIREKMKDLRVKFSPVADGVQQKVSRNIQEFHQKLTASAEELRHQLNDNAEERRQALTPDTEQRQTKIGNNTKSLRDVLTPLAEKLQLQVSLNKAGNAEEIQTRHDQRIQELLIPTLKNTTVKVNQQVGEMTEELQAKLVPYITVLKEKLIEKVRSMNQGVNQYVKDLYSTIDQIVEAFDQSAGSDRVNKVVSLNVEDMREKLGLYADSIPQERQSQLANLLNYIQHTLKN